MHFVRERNILAYTLLRRTPHTVRRQHTASARHNARSLVRTLTRTLFRADAAPGQWRAWRELRAARKTARGGRQRMWKWRARRTELASSARNPIARCNRARRKRLHGAHYESRHSYYVARLRTTSYCTLCMHWPAKLL